jgi:sulfite reductase alpha subunit-like flavoprotein
MLLFLSNQATDYSERSKLENLSKVCQTKDIFNFDIELNYRFQKDHLAYKEWANLQPNFVDLLDEFPSLRPDASLLVTQLPKLQHRFYSISSSPEAINNEIHVTAKVVEYQPIGKPTHYGVCTKWLDELKIGETVPIFIKE